MAAGISDRLWSLEDIVALIDARKATPKKREAYLTVRRGAVCHDGIAGSRRVRTRDES